MLGKLRDGSSADLLAKLLKDPSAAVRGNAAWGLQQLGDHRAVAANASEVDAAARSKVRRQASKEGRK
jgi:HEAT repeat protein